nr:MAG TPA: hypothetical protein [Caudoviricetes sp.]
MVRSSGERTRDVKRRYARRGGSIPPRAEQQEKTPYFVIRTSPPLETVQPTRKEDAGQENSHWRLGKTSKRPTIIGSKGLGNAHFFGQPERRQIKYVSQTACRRGKTAALMADIAGIARALNVNPSSFNASVSLFSFCC